MSAMMDMGKQVVTGVVPPLFGEATIRTVWPSVTAAMPPAATLGRLVMSTRVLRIFAPLTWALLLPFYFLKILPFLARRYSLTNRRVMIQRGLKPKATHEIALADIDDIRIVKDANSAFYREGTLEILSKGRCALALKGVPEPESFRHSILNAVKAWVPGKASGKIIPAKESAPAKAS